MSVSPGRRNRPVRHARAGAPRATSLVLQVEDRPVEHIVVLEPFPVEELLEQALSEISIPSHRSRFEFECSQSLQGGVYSPCLLRCLHYIALKCIASHSIRTPLTTRVDGVRNQFAWYNILPITTSAKFTTRIACGASVPHKACRCFTMRATTYCNPIEGGRVVYSGVYGSVCAMSYGRRGETNGNAEKSRDDRIVPNRIWV